MDTRPVLLLYTKICQSAWTPARDTDLHTTLLLRHACASETGESELVKNTTFRTINQAKLGREDPLYLINAQTSGSMNGNGGVTKSRVLAELWQAQLDRRAGERGLQQAHHSRGEKICEHVSQPVSVV